MAESLNLTTTWTLITIAFAIAAAYLIRVMTKGRPHYDRVERQGGSFFLSKSVMEGAYWFLEPIGKFFAWAKISPNMISWASLFFGILAGGVLAVGHFGFGAVFATISALLDSLDGMVARITGNSSDAGEVLDAAVDRYCEFFFFGGLLVYYGPVPALMLLTLLAMIGSFMVSYSTAKAEALQIAPPKGAMRRPERATYLILGAALSPITIPYLEEVRIVPIAFGHPMVIALGLVAIFGNYSAIERLHFVAKEIRAREKTSRPQN